MEHLKFIFSAVIIWTSSYGQGGKLLVGEQLRYVERFGNIWLDCLTPDNTSVWCRVGWLKGTGSRIENGSHYAMYCNGSLEITNVTADLVGAERPYRCYDVNGMLEHSNSVIIEVKNLPTPVVMNVTVVEGDTARLTCNVEGAQPPPSEFRWYHSGLLLEGERFSDLILREVKHWQYGNYTCVVSSDDNTATGSGLLIVFYIDVVNTTATNVVAVLNSSDVIHFGCQASGVPMVTDIAWSFPPNINVLDTIDFLSEYVTTSSEVIGRKGFGHSGLYNCTATNGITEKTVTFSLTIKGPPEAPNGLTLLSLSAYAAHVMWTAQFDGNDPVISYHVIVWSNRNNFTITSNQSTILLTKLLPNTLYRYKVVAQNGFGNGSSSDDAEFKTLSLPPFSPPSNVQVVLISSTAVNISWEIPQFNSSVDTILYTYIWYTSQVGGNLHAAKRSSAELIVNNRTDVIIGSLAKGTQYLFTLCLGNKEGRGPCKEVVKTTLKTAPSPPVISAVVINSDSIQLSWAIEDDGGNPSLLYSLRQRTDPNDGGVLLLSRAALDDMQYLVEHLMPNTSYWFSVVAHSDSGDIAEVSSTLVITKPLPPGTPVSVLAKRNTVTWLPSNGTNQKEGASSFYIVEYMLGTSDWHIDSSTFRTTEPILDITGIEAGRVYRVRVRAGNSGGLSDWSDPVMFTAVIRQVAQVAATSESVDDTVVIAVLCTSAAVVAIITIMIIVVSFLIYNRRQKILHSYEINSASLGGMEIEDDEPNNTYTMISMDDKPAAAAYNDGPREDEHSTSKSSLYQLDTASMQVATIKIDDDHTTPPVVVIPITITRSTDVTDV